MNENILNESVIREDMSKCLGKGKKIQPKKLDEAAGKKWVIANMEKIVYAVAIPKNLLRYIDRTKLIVETIEGKIYAIFENVEVGEEDWAMALEGEYDGSQYEEAAEVLKEAFKPDCEDKIMKALGYDIEDDGFDEVIEELCSNEYEFVKQV